MSKRAYYNCCVLRCRNSTLNFKSSFFSLPSDAQRRHIWLNLILREDLYDKPPGTHRVCEEHFDPNSILITPNRKMLKKNAVPRLLLPTSYETTGPQTVTSDSGSTSYYQWPPVTNRDELIHNEDKSFYGFPFCSLQFLKSNLPILNGDAAPSILSGSAAAEGVRPSDSHGRIICNNCMCYIQGFRYQCVVCTDFDLCQKCEMLDTHPEHLMLRITKSISSKVADVLAKTIRESSEIQKLLHTDITRSNIDNGKDGSDSSDSESVTKYDSGIELSDDMKNIIKKEVIRVVNLGNYVNPTKLNSRTKNFASNLQEKKYNIKKRIKTTANKRKRNFTKRGKKPKFEKNQCNISVVNLNRMLCGDKSVQQNVKVSFADVNADINTNDAKPILNDTTLM